MEITKGGRGQERVPGQERLGCGLCGGYVLKPNTLGAWNTSGEKTLARHTRRCRRATPAERAYYLTHRRWPHRAAKEDK